MINNNIINRFCLQILTMKGKSRWSISKSKSGWNLKIWNLNQRNFIILKLASDVSRASQSFPKHLR